MEKITKGQLSAEDIEVFEGVPEKSVEEIIQEVADEEGLTVQEVAEIWEMYRKFAKAKSAGKSKAEKKKVKNSRKQAKKSRRRNR